MSSVAPLWAANIDGSAGTTAAAQDSSAADTAATAPAAPAASPAAAAGGANTPGAASDVNAILPAAVVTAQKLDLERSHIETLTGATTTTLDAGAIAAMPGGTNVQINQVLLQAPDVVQDSFGQIHVRGDHNDLQYRLNGVILPEGVSVFSQALDPRIIASMNLLTGALPAEYGLRTAGIVDLTTKAGLQRASGSASVYGGSHSTIEPSASYGGSFGAYSYFLSADALSNDLGIESPDASSEPLHDHTTQLHGFGYFEDILNEENRLSLIAGVSNEKFEIPNQHDLQPTLGLTVNGQSSFLSNNLDENQRELAQYAIVSWQHSRDPINWVTSVSARYSSLDFVPDWTGDLLYNGIAQHAFKSDVAVAWQTDADYHLSDSHTVRAGFYLQHDHSTSDTTAQVLPTNASGEQTSDVPKVIPDSGFQSQSIESVYLQDEWKPLDIFTLNFGLRFDTYRAYSSGDQLSPRVNFIWNPAPATTVHGGFSRYFTPPPFELIASEVFTKFAFTTALPPGSVTEDALPIAERQDYYDFGVQQRLLDNALALGVDSFFQTAQHLIDEGQFGAPIVLTPFNYRFGRIGGIELTSNYTRGEFSAYANVAFQTVKAKQVESSQFNFSAAELDYIASHYIHLDHEERVSASAGVAYTWHGTRADVDMIFGTGLRQALILPDGSEIPNGDHTPSYTQWNFGLTHVFHDSAGALTLRFDIINVLDKIYQIHSGTGIGVFAPQYGARRGFFGGISQDF
jgi:hypothetical protein